MNNNHVALITGASSGIGRELAVLHAERGGNLILVARRKERLDALKQELESTHSVQVVVLAEDLTQPEAPRRIFDEIRRREIHVDLLINNAGFGGLGAFHQRDPDDDLAMIQLNISALTALTRLFLPQFLEQKRGRILNVSSTAGLVPGPYQAVYYATKAYVNSFSLALTEELRGTGVTVTTLLPGATATEFGERSGMDRTPLFRHAASAREVALDGYRAMHAGKREVISGLSLMERIMLSLLPFIPKTLQLRQIRRMQDVGRTGEG